MPKRRSKKRIFIVYSGSDEESVQNFRDLLNVILKDAKVDDKVIVTGMWAFPKDGDSWFNVNSVEIDKSDIFLLMHSPAFMNSNAIIKNEVPAIYTIRDNNPNKAVFLIKLIETPENYTKKNVFLQQKTFFTSESAARLKYYAELGENSDYLRGLYMQDLVKAMLPYIESQRNGQINYVSELPHIDDFLKGKKRKLRICKKDDPLLYAEHFMNMFPPVRHLLVIDNEESLDGLISIRDIIKYNFKDKVDVMDNLAFINEEAKKATVELVYTPREDMVCYALNENRKVEDLIQEFIKSPDINKPIGIVPVLRKKDDFRKGEYEIISYIDILKNWKSFAGYKSLENLTALNFGNQSRISVVKEDDKLYVAQKYISEGRRSLPVVNCDDKYEGIISDNEINYNEQEMSMATVKSIMRRRRPSIALTTRFGTMVDYFVNNREYTSLPVLDLNRKIVRMIGYTDLLLKIKNAIVENSDEEE